MGRKLGLCLDDVLSAAAAVADAEGLEGLSLASVAARLGVRSPSLYNHVDGLPGLRRLLAMRAALEMAAALEAAGDSGLEPEAELAALCGAYREFARMHPGLYAALLPAPSPVLDGEAAEAALRPIRVVARVVGRFGIDRATEVHVLRSLRASLHGFIDLEMRGGFQLAEPVDDSFNALVALLAQALRAQAGTPEHGPSGRPG